MRKGGAASFFQFIVVLLIATFFLTRRVQVNAKRMSAETDRNSNALALVLIRLPAQFR